MKLIIIILFTILVSSPQPNELVNIKLKVTNIENPKGVMVIRVFNNPSAFPRSKKPYKVYKVKVTSKILITDLKGLEKDTYAISIYHDVNSDNTCNMNFLGMPIERFGFSKNFKPKLSAPSFNDCSIDVKQDVSINIELID